MNAIFLYPDPHPELFSEMIVDSNILFIHASGSKFFSDPEIDLGELNSWPSPGQAGLRHI